MPENNQKNYRNSEQDRRLLDVEDSIKTINQEMGDIKVDVGSIKTTQKITLAFIMMILAGLVGLFLK